VATSLDAEIEPVGIVVAIPQVGTVSEILKTECSSQRERCSDSLTRMTCTALLPPAWPEPLSRTDVMGGYTVDEQRNTLFPWQGAPKPMPLCRVVAVGEHLAQGSIDRVKGRAGTSGYGDGPGSPWGVASAIAEYG